MRKERIISFTLRSKRCSDERKKFFATCCVIVEPPCRRAPPPLKLLRIARAMPNTSMPGWVKKRWSSAAMKACQTRFGIDSNGT